MVGRRAGPYFRPGLGLGLLGGDIEVDEPGLARRVHGGNHRLMRRLAIGTDGQRGISVPERPVRAAHAPAYRAGD